jgi:transketolase
MKNVAMRQGFGEALLELAEQHKELVVLDADVASSTQTMHFGKRYPERFFNVGVAEANMVDVAAGMATAGLRPVVSSFAIFLVLKAAEQIRNIVCYNNLPVILVGGYGGLSDSFDGASHQCYYRHCNYARISQHDRDYTRRCH